MSTEAHICVWARADQREKGETIIIINAMTHDRDLQCKPRGVAVLATDRPYPPTEVGPDSGWADRPTLRRAQRCENLKVSERGEVRPTDLP